MTASSKQFGGTHYNDMPKEMQPWNVLAQWLTPEEYRGYQKGTAIVYLARERMKNGDEDIRKAAHHLERLAEEFPVDEQLLHEPLHSGPDTDEDDGWFSYGDVAAFVVDTALYDIRSHAEGAEHAEVDGRRVKELAAKGMVRKIRLSE